MKNSKNDNIIQSGFLLLLGLLTLSSLPAYADEVKTCRDFDYDVVVQRGGTVTASFNEATCQWTLVATPNTAEDWVFMYWSDDHSNTVAERTIDFSNPAIYMSDGPSFTAVFGKLTVVCKTIQDYDFEVAEAYDESGTITFEQTEDAIILTANPNPGYVFAQWADGTAVNPRTITDFSVDDTTFFASFIPSATKGRITEWNMNGFTLTLGVSEPLVVVSSDPEINQPITLFYDGEHVSHEIDDRSLGIYYIETPPYSADDLAGKTCHIVYKNKDCEPIATLEAVIPYIVSRTEAISELDDYTPIHVLTGGVATISAPRIGPLDIYAGGQAIIDGEGTVSAGSVTMRADWPNNIGVPDLLVKGSLANRNGNIINFDYNLDWDKFYGFAVPYSVDASTSEIHYTSGIAATTSYVLGEYDGAARADDGAGWKLYYDYAYKYYGDFQDGKGYYIYGDPECWQNIVDPNHERSSSPFRFPISVDLTSPEAAASLSVSKYGNELTDISDKNWNLLASPYLTAYSGTIEMYKGSDYVADLKYIVVPQNGNIADCSAEEVSHCVLEPFTPFFVQFEEDVNTLKFAAPTASAPSPAPARRLAKAAQTPQEVAAGITLTQNGLSDHTAIYISEQYTNNYDVNADLAKMIGESERIKLYSLLGSTKLAYMALPPANGTGTLETVIPLGYDSAVVGSKMTFAVDTRRYPELKDSEDIYALELVDDVAGETQDLLEGAYTCTAYKKSDNNRFSLNIRYRAPQQKEVTTNCEEVRSTALPDGIYDLLGRPIRANANAMPAGVYIVVRDGKAEKEVIR